MGCCQSSILKELSSEKDQRHGLSNPRASNGTGAGGAVGDGGVPVFSEFSLSELKAATNNFSSEFIVSESGEKAPNMVYKGRLQNRRWIAVKKFTKSAWPDPKQFTVMPFLLQFYLRYCPCIFGKLGFNVDLKLT